MPAKHQTNQLKHGEQFNFLFACEDTVPMKTIRKQIVQSVWTYTGISNANKEIVM